MVDGFGGPGPCGAQDPLGLKPTGWSGHAEHLAAPAGQLCAGWELPAPPGLLHHRLQWKQIPLFTGEGLRFSSCPSRRESRGRVGAAPAVGLSVPPPALTSFPDTHRFPAHGSRATSYPAAVSTAPCVSQSGGSGAGGQKGEKKRKKSIKIVAFLSAPTLDRREEQAGQAVPFPTAGSPGASPAPAHPPGPAG